MEPLPQPTLRFCEAALCLRLLLTFGSGRHLRLTAQAAATGLGNRFWSWPTLVTMSERDSDAGNTSSLRARPTIYDVARLAGVSASTVSRMLNGKGQFALRTRRQVEQAVQQLGYQANTSARSLRTKSAEAIAFLLPYVPDPFFVSLIGGVEQHALRRGYATVLCVTEGDPDREAQYLNLLRTKQVDGALIDGPVLPPDRLARFVEDRFPIVCLDRDADAPSLPLVQVDNRRGARQATEYLLSLGHSRIAHVAGAELDRLPHSRDRLAGYRDALAAAGVDADPRLVMPGDYTAEGGHQATHALVESGVEFSAVFAANDLSAIGAMKALAERERRVPHDVSVVGFDDNHISEFIVPPLTTIHQPAAEIAQRGTELLVALIEGHDVDKRRHVLEPSLVVRGSAAPPARTDP